MIKFLQKSALKLFLVLAILASAGAFAQTSFTITHGFSGLSGVPTGIQVVSFDGSTSCSTTSNGANAVTTLTLKAMPGYEFKVTSVSGIGVRSNAGPSSFTLQVVNNGTASGTATNITGGGSCGTPNNLPAFNVPTAQQQVNENGTIQIKVQRAPGTTSGAGYSHATQVRVVGTVQTAVPPVPDAPVATAATQNNTGSSFVANWNSVNGATGYRLDVATDMAFTNILEDYDNIAVTGTSHLVNIGIQPNTLYHYRVRAENGPETSVNSNIIDVTTSAFILQPPVATTATGLLTDGFTATWNPSFGATGYYLDVSTSPDFGVVEESFKTETFTLMPAAAAAYVDRTWIGDEGTEWFATQARTDRFTSGSTTDRVLTIYESASGQAELVSGPITGNFNAIGFDTWKILSNGTSSTVTASVLSGTNFETETIIGTQTTPTVTTAKNTFTATLPSMITGPYKIKIAVTENASGARTGIDNLKYGTRTVTTPLYVTGYSNLDVGNVTSYQVTGLEPGTKYYYRVRAYTTTETSGNSNTADVTTNCITVTPPTAAPIQLCAGATVAELVLAEENVHWYTVQTGGTELAETASISTGTYYASLFTGNCESTRVAISVVTLSTSAPVAVPVNVCGAGTVADLVLAGTNLKWYADATTETPLAPETPVVGGVYYVTQTLSMCESPRRAIAVTVTPIPGAVTAEAQTFCGETTVAELVPAPATGTTMVIEDFETPITGTINANHTFSTGEWAVLNGGTETSTLYSYSGNSIRFGNATKFTSPAFDKIRQIRFHARAVSPKTVEVKKIVGGVETVLQTITISTTMTQYTVPVNEINDDVQLSFTGMANSTNVYLDHLEIIMSADTPEIQWFAAETGGTALAGTETLASGNYYVAEVFNGCEGPRTQVAVTINTIPAAPAATPLTLCGEPTVAQLTAPGTNLKWYAAQSGGSALADTDAVTAGNYYVSQTVDNCEGPRAEVAVTINPVPAAPATTPLTFCGSATAAQLTATGDGLKWYAAETGGSPLAGTEALTSTTYYVSQTVDTCESPRASVAVTVSELPDGPVVAALSFCGNTTASQLPLTGGTAMKWYTAETGGTALTGTEAVTTGDYYVSQTVDGCESLRVLVEVTVNPIPVAPVINEFAQTFCSGATVADLLPQNAAIKWYTAPANGTALTAETVLSAGLSIYYASQTVDGCESTARTAVAVQVNTTALPVANGNYTFCNTATVANLTAAGTALKWYETESATDALASTTALTTATYYVTQTINNCESAKVPVAVTVSEATAPIADPIILCGASTVANLTANGTNLKWYVSNTAMDMLDNSAAVTTNTYYVSQTIGTCESPRTPVSVTVNTTAVISAGPFTFCNEATVGELTASGASVKWYAAATDTDELEETVALATGTYYVTQTVNDCESAKTPVSVTVTVPLAVGAALQQYTTGETLADLDVTGPGIVWYADENLTQELPATTVLTDWYTYYAVPNIGDCAGEALPVAVDDMLGNEGFNTATFKYYPNPVKDVLNISYNETITGVEVYNMLGQAVISKAPNAETLQIDMAALRAGTYMVRLQAGNSTQTIKLIKQ